MWHSVDLKGLAGFHTLTHSLINSLHYKSWHKSLIALHYMWGLFFSMSYYADIAHTRGNNSFLCVSPSSVQPIEWTSDLKNQKWVLGGIFLFSCRGVCKYFFHLSRPEWHGLFFLSFDGIVLVTQNHDTLPAELECLKAPLQDYSSVSLCSLNSQTWTRFHFLISSSFFSSFTPNIDYCW